MQLKLEKNTERDLLNSIKRFFTERLDEEIGDLKARLVLEYCIREVGPTIYNNAIADAQTYIQEKASELGNSRYEPEFVYWKK